MERTGLWHRFGLTASPFETTPSTTPWTAGPLHQPFADLRAAIDGRMALVLLAGELGSGRTTLARAAIAASTRATAAAWLPAAQAESPAALCSWLLERLGGPAPAAGGGDAARLVLQRIAARGALAAAPLVVVDDLEELPGAVGDDLLRLLAVASGAAPPLSVLMIGEPPLKSELAKWATASLAPAQIATVEVPALTVEATAAYIGHRLATAGYGGPPPFTADALIRIANLSRGRPLHINRLCEACFDGASPNSLPLGSDVVVAALANSLSASTAPVAGDPAAATASPTLTAAAAAEDEGARLERLAGRVNAVIHRSFTARVAGRAAPAVTPPVPPEPAHPHPATTTATPPAAPAPSIGRRRPPSLFALSLMVVIGIAGAATGWRLIVGDWRWLAPRQPAPVTALTEAAAGPGAAPPAAASAGEPTAAPSETATAPSAPAAPPKAAAPMAAAPPARNDAVEHDPAVLLARGEALLRQADVAAAQSFFRVAAEQGSAAGAMALAASFDPLALKETGIRGARANAGEALAWYRRAAELGEASAEARHQRLIDHLRRAAAGGDPAARETLGEQR